MSSLGPLVSRMVADGMVHLFSVTLQRETIDVSGTGQLTIGELPKGIDNSSLTWVPVRLHSTTDGGLQAPTL